MEEGRDNSLDYLRPEGWWDVWSFCSYRGEVAGGRGRRTFLSIDCFQASNLFLPGLRDAGLGARPGGKPFSSDLTRDVEADGDHKSPIADGAVLDRESENILKFELDDVRHLDEYRALWEHASRRAQLVYNG